MRWPAKMLSVFKYYKILFWHDYTLFYMFVIDGFEVHTQSLKKDQCTDFAATYDAHVTRKYFSYLILRL
jgi:hypothetical protein